MRQDPLTASPQQVFKTTAVTDQDFTRPGVNDVLITPDGRLLLADYHNKMIKVMSLSHNSPVISVKLNEAPLNFAQLSDGLVALTAENKTVFLVDIGVHVSVKSQVQTARQYTGVADGPEDDTLIVLCCEDPDGPARVDIVQRRDGVLVRTVVGDRTLSGLRRAGRIYLRGVDMLICDWSINCIYKLHVTSGRLMDTITHPDMNGPFGVVADEKGNMYVSCIQSKCVLLLTTGGEWKKLLQAAQHSDKDCDHPMSLCLTMFGIVVVWKQAGGNARVIVGYDLV